MADYSTQTSSFMRTRLREDNEFEAPHIKLKRPNIMTGALDVRKAPNIKDIAPNIKTRAPNIKTRAPNIKTNAPNFTTYAPNTKTYTPNIKTKAPNIRR